VVMLAHVVILVCIAAQLVLHELTDQHEIAPFRIEQIYYWSLPIVWGASFVVRTLVAL